MLKKLLFLSTLFVGGISFGQNIPTMVSYSVDTLCQGETGQFITVTIEDLDGDSTYIDNFSAINTVLNEGAGFTVINPPYVPLATQRTFQIIGQAEYTLPTGVNLEDLGMDIVGNTTNDNGGGYDVATGIPVYGYIPVDLVASPITICPSGASIDLDQYAITPDGTWVWPNQSSPNYGYTESNALDPKIAYDVYVADGGDGYYIEYTIENSAGCSNYEFLEVDFYDPMSVTVAATPSSCENANGSAIATIAGTSSPYDVSWTTGFSETLTGAPTSTIDNASSGVYYANITDNNGCKAVGKANIFDADLIVTETITPVYCAGTTGSVDLAVSSSGNVTDVYWSNGQTTQTMNALAGEYSVQLHTDNNCNFFGTYIIPDSSLKVVLDSYGDNFDCISTPAGFLNVTTSGGDGTYSWDWQKNLAQVSTMEDLANVDGGIYECTVSDGSGCSLTWDYTLGNYSNTTLWVQGQTKSTCGNSDAEVDIFIDDFGDVPSFYEWSNGSTDEDLTGVGSGTYTLTYQDQSGCESYLTIEIIDELPYQPSICLLTVDISYTYNQVVWEKVPGEPIEAFNIYRETSNLAEFELVNTRDYALESFFMDNSASPVDRSWRYAITTVDACGNESNKSFAHKTIHTVSNTQNGTDYTISWDDYEGIDYSDVTLFRYDNNTGDWLDIGTHAAGVNSAPDTPPTTDGLDYYVSFNLTDGCQSTKATDYNSSRSNKADTAFDPGESTTSIEDEEYGMINIYPNPTSSIVNLYIEQYDMYERIELRDMNGRILSQKSVSNQNEMIDLSEFANGVYFISIISGNESHQQKIIKR